METHIKDEYLTFQYLTLPQVSCGEEKEENLGNETDDLIYMTTLDTMTLLHY